jgi:hypothetical protein
LKAFIFSPVSGSTYCVPLASSTFARVKGHPRFPHFAELNGTGQPVLVPFEGAAVVKVVAAVPQPLRDT